MDQVELVTAAAKVLAVFVASLLPVVLLQGTAVALGTPVQASSLQAVGVAAWVEVEMKMVPRGIHRGSRTGRVG